MFAGVRKQPNATTLTVGQDGTLQLQKWWRPDWTREIRLRNDQDYYEGVRELTIRAVHDRMRSQRPVVCYLSGGLDSSSVTCIAARKMRDQGKRLTTISSVLPVDHNGPEVDERQFIEFVNHAEDLDAQYIHPQPGMLEDVSPCLDLLEAPLFSPKQYLYTAFHAAAKSIGAGVILDGCGGEFGPTNHADGLMAWLACQGHWGTLARELRALGRHEGQSVFRAFVRHVVCPYIPNLQAWFHRTRNPSYTVRPLNLPLNPDFVRRHGLASLVTPNGHRLTMSVNPKKRLARAIESIASYLGPDSTMASGMRTRYPFGDRRLIDFCLSVPVRLYQVDGWKRNLIRRAMDGILPPEIQWRKCKGAFSPDFYRRFQNERQAMRDEFTAIGPDDMARDYYDIDAIIRLIDELADGPGHETSPEGLAVKLCLQSSLGGIRFLHWFQKVNVDVASMGKAA